MAEVVVELDGQEVVRVPLNGQKTIIGRDQTADVYLENRALSRKHAQLEKRGAGIWIRDLESQNGTYVNGERILEPIPLSSDDSIQLGRYDVYIEGVKEASGDTTVFTVSNAEGRQRYALVGEEVIVGRSPNCDIPITHKSISRRHFKLTQDNGLWFIEDMGSQNGTRRNGNLIDGSEAFSMEDVVQVSEYTFELSILDSETTNSESGFSDSVNKTMMIDPSNLAKVADLGGDLAVDEDEEDQEGADISVSNLNPPEEIEFADEEMSQTKGLSDFAKDIAFENTKSSASKSLSAQKQHVITFSIEDLNEELFIENEPLAIGENGSYGTPESGQIFADQAYILFTPTAQGVLATVVGDRRLLMVNGESKLFAFLESGQTVELGHLHASYEEK